MESNGGGADLQTMNERQRFHRHKCFDFGPGCVEIDSTYPGGRLGVVFHVPPVALNEHECERLGQFLMEASVWMKERRSFTSDPKGTVVYAITDGDAHHKIGKAVNFANRLKQLQTGNGRRLRLVAFLRVDDERTAYIAETAAKRSLADFQAVGEWFECNSHHALQALYEAAAVAGVEWPPISVCVGHDDDTKQEAATYV